MPVFEVVSGGDRRSLIKRFMRKGKAQAVSELIDLHLLHCTRIENLEQQVKELENALARVADLEKQVAVAWGAFHFGGERDGKLYTHSETEAQIEAYILDMHRSSDSLTLRKGPLYAGPVAQAQQLHDLDKQCRDDVARALGLRPNQERGFAWSYLLASIKSCVKASEDSAQAQHSVPDGAADLCRFLAKLYCELDGLRYSTAKLPAEQIADALIFKWPVLQGARNQLNIKRISEQPYDESKLHSAIAAMLAAAPVCRLSRSALTEAQMRRLYENSTETENERLGFEAFARLIRRAEAVHQIAAAPGKEVGHE
ncbi:TPA: hypothetical protein ACXN4Q_000489 [Pseudomonas aeruginosa]